MATGIIYEIFSPSKNLRYIGSTFLTLKMRQALHISRYKRILQGKAKGITASKVLAGMDTRFSQISEHPGVDKSWLLQKEKDVINEMKNIYGSGVVNHNIGLTDDMKAYQKTYRDDPARKEAKKIYMKIYQQKNPDKFKIANKKSYEKKKLNQSAEK